MMKEKKQMYRMDISVTSGDMSMVRQIACKEVLENLLSLRFIFSLLLIILLLAASGSIFVDKYRQQSRDYWQKISENLAGFREQSSQLYKLAFYEQNVYRKPKPLVFCAEGFEESLPGHFKFNVFTIGLPELKGQSNFTLPYFSDIDWVFIVSLILSFVALVLTYDSICGEKQAGTLRQMLACSIARHKVLFGKYVGIMFTLGIPLLVGLLFNLIIVISSRDVAINAGEWLKILTIVLLSFLYLSVFVLLGMFVSSRSAHPANCMVILLLVWVALVILIPSLGRVISDAYCKSLTPEEFERRKSEALEQVDNDVAAGKFGKNAGARYGNRDDPGNNPSGRARYCNALTDAENRVVEGHHNEMMAQALTGRYFTCLSPSIVYQRASEAIAGTGISRCANLCEQIHRYKENLKEYILSKDRQDPDSLHLLFDEEHTMADWHAISHKPVDFDTVPQFQERKLGLGESLQLAIWDIGLLVLFNLLFFVAAFVSFLRYDVR